jgi:hypothetical protein
MLPWCVAGCESRSSERTREVVDDAARTAERGVEKARAGTLEAMDQAQLAAEQAKRGLGEARDDARDGIADARERYGVDDKVEDAKQRLAVGLDEAAQSFAELGEAGKARADELGDKLGEVGQAGLDIAPEAIVCNDELARVCKIDPELIATLAAKPKLLVSEVSLRPKQGETGQGLQLVRARAQSLTQMLGLREGDILLSVNGAELGSFEAIRALDEALSGKPEAKLIYERDGERGELTVIQQTP